MKKSTKNNLTKILLLGAASAAAGAVAGKLYKNHKAKTAYLTEAKNALPKRQMYMSGGGLASMAAALYLIRDCGVNGENIHIYESLPVLGGSNDGIGTNEGGFLCRGGRMLNEETYENFWDLMSSVPSLEIPDMSVTDEILNFDHSHPTHAKARLIDRNGIRLNVKNMGFNSEDRRLLTKLLLTDETELDDMTIEDFFGTDPHFFETNFWYMWQTTFAFQKWSSLFEFRRYMKRMIFEFSRIETLEGVTRTPYNQYDSVILPLKVYLEDLGVDFVKNCTVTDIDFTEDDTITVSALHLTDKGTKKTIYLNKGDLFFMTNGCMTDCSSIGDFNSAPPECDMISPSAQLWKKAAAKKEGLGNPEPFFGCPEKSNWESFTVTLRGSGLLKMIKDYSGNVPGSGALMTFRDSSWLMSIVVAAQPHFINQNEDTTIFWGYGLYTDKEGDYVKKPMKECTGEEILYELICHLHWQERWEDIKKTVVNCIPCMMPYVDAQFMPRKMSDRPQVVPKGSTNLAMISQFVEIPKDMVFTEEYSVRAARIAVYKLMNVKNKKVIPVTPYDKRAGVIAKALKKMYT